MAEKRLQVDQQTQSGKEFRFMIEKMERKVLIRRKLVDEMRNVHVKINKMHQHIKHEVD